MKEVNQISEKEKEEITKALFDLYKPKSIGQIKKYPPYGEYYVSLQFDLNRFNIKVENRYNHTVMKNNENPEKDLICDFELSNAVKMGEDFNILLKITKQ